MLHPTAPRLLGHTEPFDGGQVIRFLAGRLLPGVESVVHRDDAVVYSRSLRGPSGPAVIEAAWADRRLTLRTWLSDPADEAVVTERMRRLFDVDAPAAEIDAVLSRHPVIRPLVEAQPGIRIPGAVDAAEMTARAIVGQQISVVAAVGHLTELLRCGDELPEPVGEVTRLFPTAAQLAETGADLLRAPASRRETLRSLSSAQARGVLRLGAHRDPDELRAELVAYRGIGPWTADYLAMRLLAAPDVMMPGDSALRLGLRRLLAGSGSNGAADEPLLRFAEPFRPWRSYLALHLWNAATDG